MKVNSPYSGKPMRIVYEDDTWEFRGEVFPYVHIAFRDDEIGEQFTTTESDTLCYEQVTNQYRVKHGIPFTDEIIAVRDRYGLNASKMSIILGMGINQYRLYEQGEVPSVSNGKLIRSIMNPKVMLQMVESARNELAGKEYDKILSKVKSAIADSESHKMELYEKERVFSVRRGADNGYAPLSLNRLKNVMLYILSRCGSVWVTKMNKLLFYVDFLSYRERGMGMTGLAYRAIQFGPVPERWDRVYSEFAEIKQELCQFDHYEGSLLSASAQPDESLFSDKEKEILNEVCNQLGSSKTSEVVDLSHKETAWLDYQGTHGKIPFTEAFRLKAVTLK